jgi:hypothetical protein
LWIAPASGNHEAWWRERREEVLPRRKNEECGTNKMSNLEEKCIGRKGVLRPTERHERQCLKYGAHDDMRIFCPSVLYKCRGKNPGAQQQEFGRTDQCTH